ncbi:MAG: hypothetical protein KatS3mg123_2183 [Burkholderiales bacterium]|nr:MAG: hypothetical protein KatS3mg123_2183 [Burkholderiales bacterium]
MTALASAWERPAALLQAAGVQGEPGEPRQVFRREPRHLDGARLEEPGGARCPVFEPPPAQARRQPLQGLAGLGVEIGGEPHLAEGAHAGVDRGLQAQGAGFRFGQHLDHARSRLGPFHEPDRATLVGEERRRDPDRSGLDRR